MQTRGNNYSKQGSSSLQCFPVGVGGSVPSRSLTPVDTARGSMHGSARPALLGRLCSAGSAFGDPTVAAWSRPPRGRLPHGGWPTPRRGALLTALPEEPGLPHPPAGRPGALVGVQSWCSPAQRRGFPACAGLHTEKRCELPRGPQDSQAPLPSKQRLFSPQSKLSFLQCHSKQ